MALNAMYLQAQNANMRVVGIVKAISDICILFYYCV